MPKPAAGGLAMKSTLASMAAPGLGHLVARKPAIGALILVCFGAGLAVAVFHLTRGMAFFESSLGGFLFPVLLRGLVVLHLFAAFDAYVWALDPDGDLSLPRRRRAVLLNALAPGTGYLLARAWIRAATGLALLALVLVFARSGRHPYLDLIFMGMQAVMAVAVYHRLGSEAQARLDREGRGAPELPAAPGAQIALLLLSTAALFAVGFVAHRALPGVHGVTSKDVKVLPDAAGIRLGVPTLGLSLVAAGDGWIANASPTSGLLFEARHRQGASLMLGLQPIPGFMRRERYLRRVRQWMEGKDLTFQRATELEIGGRKAVQMRFSENRSPMDHWTVTVPVAEQKVAYLLLIGCERKVCKELLPELERTRDSLRVKP